MLIQSVLKYLENSASDYGEKAAISDETGTLTFLDLHNQSKVVAHEIIKRIEDVKRQPVLIYLPKTKQAIVSMLGTLYSGNFYTPTNVDFPLNKTAEIIDVLNPVLVISDHHNKNKLIKLGLEDKQILCVEDLDFNVEINKLKHRDSEIIDTDPAYIYFTSGSTGKPKGVTITHRNIIDYIEWACSKFPIDEKTIFGNQSALYFDITTQDLYATLKCAATMIIIPERLFAFPVKVAEFINEKNINFLYWVPSAYINFSIYNVLETHKLDSVQTMMFGGEVMPVKHLNYWRKNLRNLNFIANVYGPTEATVNITYYVVDREFNENETLPLGHVIENKRVILLDEDDNLITSNNTKGELCVMGSSVASGYYDNRIKSSSAFIQNPVHSKYAEIVYRTGDLVTYNDDGLLIFCGRKDNQIKHLGYRIELGEIEAAVASLDYIANCIVLYNADKRQIIVLYVASRDEVTARQMKVDLMKSLPKYMVPTKYFQVPNLPLNNNGKIDRHFLQEKYC